MIEHHIQKNILNHLVTVPCARFAELKPAGVEGNIFTYHLHELIKHKYVAKQEDGSYCLTPLGKAAGIHNKLSGDALLQQAHSILLLMVRDEQGRWLLRKRLVHPMHGKIGFIHAEPVVNEPIMTTAARVLNLKSGLTADFMVIGSGYIRILQNEGVESFTHFTLLGAVSATGELIEADATGENAWYADPDFSDARFIPSMKDIAQHADSDQPFFTELEYHLHLSPPGQVI